MAEGRTGGLAGGNVTVCRVTNWTNLLSTQMQHKHERNLVRFDLFLNTHPLCYSKKMYVHQHGYSDFHFMTTSYLV